MWAVNFLSKQTHCTQLWTARYTETWVTNSEDKRGGGANYVAYFCLSVVSLPIVQINPFTPGPGHTATDRLPVLPAEASACNTGTTQTQPHQISNTQRTENKTTDVVIQQHSRKLLMMDILKSETCWAHKTLNKIASDIKLVFYSSTINIWIRVSLSGNGNLKSAEPERRGLDTLQIHVTAFRPGIHLHKALRLYLRHCKLSASPLKRGRPVIANSSLCIISIIQNENTMCIKKKYELWTVRWVVRIVTTVRQTVSEKLYKRTDVSHLRTLSEARFPRTPVTANTNSTPKADTLNYMQFVRARNTVTTQSAGVARSNYSQ